ncbi:MAG: hypothetical protein Q8L29_02565 [archaeon]|nr:hypothetical protein [archaeon]
MAEKHVVGPIIELNGRVKLKEVFENANNIKYYAVLSASTKTEGTDNYKHPDITIDVPITRAQYDDMRKALSESKAEEPTLWAEGKLEILLGFKSWN